MKKVLVIISLIMIVNILIGEVCWENGVPLYEGNFIYREKSISTSASNIFITWAELDNGYRKLKLQKTDSTGEPIWTDPITIDQNEQFLLENNIIASEDDGCFINAFYQNRSNQKLYKIDSNGNLLWQHSHNSSYAVNLLPLANGGVIKSEIDHIDNCYYLKCSYIDDSGEMLWDNDQLYNFQSWNSEEILEQQYVNGFFYFLLTEENHSFILKVNEAGEVVNQSDTFSSGYYNSAKFINNSFFVFYLNPDTSDLEMHNLDLDGNSILNEDPKIICDTHNWKADQFTFSESYFYAIISNANEHLVFHKCDFEGDILNTFTHANEFSSYNIEVYDQEVDFISYCTYAPTFDAYLLKLNENSISEPIYYLPENSTNYWGEKYFLDDNFSFVGIGNSSNKEIYTMRKTENSTIVYTIRDIIYEIINPTITMKNSNLASYWHSYDNNAIMIQEYDNAGNPQYQENGEVLIEGINYFRIIEDRIFTLEYSENNSNIMMSCYNLAGENIWSDQFAGTQHDFHIYPFYDDYVFICKEIILEPTQQHILKFIAFDEDGLLWSEAVTLDITEPSTFGDIQMKGNVLFFRSYHTVYCVSVNSDGTYTQPQILADNSDMLYTYGNEDNFLTVTRDGITSLREVHYFQNGNLMWDNAWEVFLGDYGNLHTLFEEDGFYLIGYNYPDSINIDKFDYNHNLIVESSFDYTSQNPIISGFNFFKQSDKYIFVINSMLSNYDNQFSILISDVNGNILVPEFSEIIMERDNMEYIRSTLFVDNCLYMPIACGYKPLEGEYERNYYMQKVDLSDYVEAGEIGVITSKISLSCYPNPFNPSTTISFSIQDDSDVELSIFNIKGQKVKTLTEDVYGKGQYQISWNGKNNEGNQVSSGIYFYQLNANGKVITSKVLLLK
ncbi:MAG: hypothetical protein APR54_13145 [Candidatus Cloacimonas sp. SDB]|nr:MAG: hypothetical protein APR54_13145 [Candidatus Cloacimonas sp. SDB]